MQHCRAPLVSLDGNLSGYAPQQSVVGIGTAVVAAGSVVTTAGAPVVAASGAPVVPRERPEESRQAEPSNPYQPERVMLSVLSARKLTTCRMKTASTWQALMAQSSPALAAAHVAAWSVVMRNGSSTLVITSTYSWSSPHRKNGVFVEKSLCKQS